MNAIFEELQVLHAIVDMNIKFMDEKPTQWAFLSHEKSALEFAEQIDYIVNSPKNVPIEYRYLFEACVSIFTARTEAFLIEAEEEMVRYEEEERYDEVIRDITY